MAHRLDTTLQYPCGCVVWKYGGDEGMNPCAVHHSLHLKMMDFTIYAGVGYEIEKAPIECDCPQHRAKRFGMRTWDYVVDRVKKDEIGRQAAKPMTDRGPEGDVLSYMDDCGCLWERIQNSWQCTKQCGKCGQFEIEQRQLRRNYHP